MKLTLLVRQAPIEVVGLLEAQTQPTITEVYLDDKRVPPTLERIILLGMNTMQEQYLNEVEMMMRLEKGI